MWRITLTACPEAPDDSTVVDHSTWQLLPSLFCSDSMLSSGGRSVKRRGATGARSPERGAQNRQRVAAAAKLLSYIPNATRGRTA
jgi:hypothetical protein